MSDSGEFDIWLRRVAGAEPGPVAEHLLDVKLGGLRARTIIERHRILAAVGRQLMPVELVDADAVRLREWWRLLGTRGLTNKTRAVYLSHVVAFYRWALAEGLIDVDPTRRLRAPKLERRLPRPADVAAVRGVLSRLEGTDHTIVTLAAFCGLRAMEIAAVRADDVRDLDTGRPGLLVRGKGGHERIVPIPLEVARRIDAAPSDRPAVGTRRGTRYSAHEMSARLASILRRAGINATGHQLRHLFATEMYRATGDLRATQDALGHRRPETTAGYAAVTETAIRDGAEQVWSTLGRPAPKICRPVDTEAVAE